MTKKCKKKVEKCLLECDALKQAPAHLAAKLLMPLKSPSAGTLCNPLPASHFQTIKCRAGFYSNTVDLRTMFSLSFPVELHQIFTVCGCRDVEVYQYETASQLRVVLLLACVSGRRECQWRLVRSCRITVVAASTRRVCSFQPTLSATEPLDSDQMSGSKRVKAFTGHRESDASRSMCFCASSKARGRFHLHYGGEGAEGDQCCCPVIPSLRLWAVGAQSPMSRNPASDTHPWAWLTS